MFSMRPPWTPTSAAYAFRLVSLVNRISFQYPCRHPGHVTSEPVLVKWCLFNEGGCRAVDCKYISYLDTYVHSCNVTHLKGRYHLCCTWFKGNVLLFSVASHCGICSRGCMALSAPSRSLDQWSTHKARAFPHGPPELSDTPAAVFVSYLLYNLNAVTIVSYNILVYFLFT